MIPRMTTVGVLKNYRYSLNRSNNTMYKAMNTITTQRNFNSYAEDPALATRCFQLRHSYLRTQAQLTVNDSLRHKYDVAWEALENISTDLYALSADTSLTSVIESLNDPTGPGRVALGQSLAAKAQDIAQIMNGRYGENYVFAGADTLNAPFTWEAQKNPAYVDPEIAAADPEKYSWAFQYLDENNIPTNDINAAADKLEPNPDYDPSIDDPNDPNFDINSPHYQKPYLDANGNPTGNPADAAKAKVENPDYIPGINPGDDGYQPKYLDENGVPTDDPDLAATAKMENPDYDETAAYKYLAPDGTGTNDQKEARMVLCYRGVYVDSMEEADQAKMNYFLNGESKYIDVGLGHKEENGEAVSSTVFDCALQGIYYLGGCGTKSVEVTMDDGTIKTVEGIPQNIISVVSEMGEILQRCDPDNGRWASADDQLRFKALTQQFEESTNTFRQRWTALDTQTGFLRDNSELLEGTAYSLQTQYMELEEADPAAAISEYMFARYSFDAALKVGNSVLSQSLMDYLNL